MLYPLSLHSVCGAYINRTAKLMFGYHSDILFDIDKIKVMKIGDTMYFLVAPLDTHTASSENLKEKIEMKEQVFGGHVIIAIKRVEQNKYYIWNYAKNTNKSFPVNTPDYILNNYKDFQVEEF